MLLVIRVFCDLLAGTHHRHDPAIRVTEEGVVPEDLPLPAIAGDYRALLRMGWLYPPDHQPLKVPLEPLAQTLRNDRHKPVLTCEFPLGIAQDLVSLPV